MLKYLWTFLPGLWTFLRLEYNEQRRAAGFAPITTRFVPKRGAGKRVKRTKPTTKRKK